VNNKPTYKEHYEKSREASTLKDFNDSKYSSLYDLTIDTEFLNIDLEYHDIVERLSKKISKIFDQNDPTALMHTAGKIFLKEWKKITEIDEYINYIMPQIENQIFHCNTHLEFIKVSRNVIDAKNPEVSWLWHYDDCPSEYLKFVVYLNEVNEQSGCMQFIENPDKTVTVLPSSRICPDASQETKKFYPSSRVPAEALETKLKSGCKIKSLTGPIGTYAIFTPNIIHRATVPMNNTKPRDCIFLYIRPSVKKRTSYIAAETNSVLPKRNVKKYILD